jgi:hypothetical protein
MPNIQLGSQDNLYYEYTPPESESRFTFCFFNALTGDTNTWETVIGPRLRAAGHGTLAYNLGARPTAGFRRDSSWMLI